MLILLPKIPKTPCSDAGSPKCREENSAPSREKPQGLPNR
jgi:hypothetical protein